MTDHDHDHDRTVQVPASLVERIERELEYRVRTAVARWKAADHDGRDAVAVVNEEVRGGRVAVRAYLTPAPTAEPFTRYSPWQAGCTPTRVEDMALGTTKCADPNVNRWYCHRRGTDGMCPLPKCVDPSTIRDVTPPVETT